MNIDKDVLLSLDPKHDLKPDLPDMALEDPDQSYFEGLFPKGQVHLFAGSSGAGKTTLAFEMYRALTQMDGEWLGRKTIPAAWAYISGDRASNSVKNTQKRIGVDFKIFSLVDHGMVGADIITDVFPSLPKFYGYRPNFVYIDGFTSMCPGGKLNEYQPVARWLANMQMYCQRKNMTMVGACHTTKVREGEQFIDPRQRIAGSVAWAAYSESVVLIETTNTKGKDDGKRRVMLLPRNAPGDSINMEFAQDGTLRVSDSSIDAVAADSFVLGTLMVGFTKGEEIYYLKLWSDAQKKHIGRRTFDRWLAKMVEGGILGRVKKGVYVKL